MILVMLAIEWSDYFRMRAHNQKQHCVMFVVPPQHHLQNYVYVSLDTQKVINILSFIFGRINLCSILREGNLKAN